MTVTADEDLLHCADPADDNDSERVENIHREIAAGFAALALVGKAVSASATSLPASSLTPRAHDR